MLQKISVIPLCAILVVIIALFATTPAGAQGEETCPPTTGQAGPYTINLVGGSPSLAPSGDGWVWVYEITAYPQWKIHNIKKVLFTYPDCCGEDIQVLEPAIRKITPPCEPALLFPKWPMVCDDFTLKLPFMWQNEHDKKISFTTDTSNVGINTIGIKTYFRLYVAAIAGPACAGELNPVENEPVSAEKVFRSKSPDGLDVLEWALLSDLAGNSFDAEIRECLVGGAACGPEFKVQTVRLDEIKFSAEKDGQTETGVLDSLPTDLPVVTKINPFCIYVRTRSGGVKKVGDCP